MHKGGYGTQGKVSRRRIARCKGWIMRWEDGQEDLRYKEVWSQWEEATSGGGGDEEERVNKGGFFCRGGVTRRGGGKWVIRRGGGGEFN
jgi:hypothetical protein